MFLSFVHVIVVTNALDSEGEEFLKESERRKSLKYSKAKSNLEDPVANIIQLCASFAALLAIVALHNSYQHYSLFIRIWH